MPSPRLPDEEIEEICDRYALRDCENILVDKTLEHFAEWLLEWVEEHRILQSDMAGLVGCVAVSCYDFVELQESLKREGILPCGVAEVGTKGRLSKGGKVRW